jgi:CRP-like cAMP-binding protein
MTDVVDLTERMLHIRQIPVGAVLPPAVVRVIASHCDDRTFAEGEPLMRAGEPIDAFYMLTDGAASLVREGALAGEIEAPQTLGFLAILARAEGPYDAVAKSPVRALELETDTLLDIFADHFELLEATLRYLGERMYFDMQELPEGALGLPALDLPPAPRRRLDLVDRVVFLRKTSVFATANVNALAVMARAMDEVRAPAGHRFWSPGDVSARSLFLMEGTVRCETADGRTFRYGPGTAVGGIEAIADRPRWYGVTAETDVVGLFGRTDHLFDIFEHQLAMAMDFVAMLARAQLAIAAQRAKAGQKLTAVRDVSKLGAVRVGA